MTTNAQGRRRSGYTAGLQTIEETYGLVDAWRERHPGRRDITHVCASDMSGARLDRWLVSLDLLLLTQQADILEGLPGDHCGVSIHIQSPLDTASGPRPWAFPLTLLDDPAYDSELKSLVQHAVQHGPIHAAFSHGQRWEHLKRQIRDHATEYLRRSRLRESAMLHTLRTRARNARSAFAADPSGQLSLLVCQETNRALQQHIHDKAQAAAVRAGVLWQHYGEQSTFYFYRLKQQRKVNTTLTSITDTEGNTATLGTTEGRVRAGKVLADYFSSDSPHGLFAGRPVCQTAQQTMLAAVDRELTDEASRACEGAQPMTLAELAQSLSTMPRGRQPGSDGLPYEFLQHFWQLLGPLLLEVYLEAFQQPDSSLPTSQRHGTITLLYKGSGSRSDPAAYRPITLQNSDAKLLAKALTDRWGRHVASVVDSTQTAFIPGRWIGDNVLAHLEEVEYLETSRDPGCIAFLDFSKAYDRLSRDWVLLCMEKMGFGPSARRWVSLLHSHLTADVRYNGWHSPAFPVNTGLAQGSPLFPPAVRTGSAASGSPSSEAGRGRYTPAHQQALRVPRTAQSSARG